MRARKRTSWVWALACTIAALAPGKPAAQLPREQAATGEALDHSVETRLAADGQPYDLHRWRIPLARVRIDVVDVGMGRDLAPYVRRGAALAINGGFYGTDGRPEGLVIARSRALSPFLARIGGGIVSIAGARAAHHDANAPLELPEGARFAIQCRPRLVVDGRVNIRSPRPETAARTALCLRDDGAALDVYVARVEPSRGRAGPTLWTLAHHLVEEGCSDALNLDGGPSTGVAWRAADGVRHLPPRRGIRHAVLFALER